MEEQLPEIRSHSHLMQVPENRNYDPLGRGPPAISDRITRFAYLLAGPEKGIALSGFKPEAANRSRNFSQTSAYAPGAASTLAGSILTPGPMEEETATRLTYVPLAPAGFALTTASASARMFSSRAAAVKEALPIPA